jgi:hypothetical protein
MSYAQWNSKTQYIVGDQVVSAGVLYICILAIGPSTNPPAADATHWTSQGSPIGFLPSGKYTCVVGTTQVITIPNLTTNSIVNLTYVHPPIGGGPQYFVDVVPTANTLTITLNQTATTAEFILWSVASL